MKKRIIALAPFILWATFAYASEMKMVFWYPGEAGTTEEAQPVLDTFLDYVSGKVKTVKLTGRYFNTTEDGLSFIAKQKPSLAIISYAAWNANKEKLTNAQVWLATNPLPHGQKEESYFLVGKKPLAASGTAFSSEPLSPEFIKNQLGFSQIQNFKQQSTSQILMKLKSIAEGTQAGAAILTPTEGATFQKMTAPWTKSLEIIAKSKAVPTARVVIFNQLPQEANNLRQVLLGLKNEPEAKEILEELRLVGFSEP